MPKRVKAHGRFYIKKSDLLIEEKIKYWRDSATVYAYL